MTKFYLIIVVVFLNINTSKSFSQTALYTINDVSVAPDFVGGQSKLNEFVATNFVSPEIDGVTGTIKVTFVIEVDGKLTNIKIVQNLGDDFAVAATKVFSKSPNWLPGELNGEKVRVQMNYPITIR